MSNKTSLLLASALFGASLGAYAQTIPTNTKIEVRTDEVIDGRDSDAGRVYPGSVARDVTDTNGSVVIPRGSRAEFVVRRVSNNEVAVDLDGITVNGKHYSVPATDVTRSDKQGVGENKRTGKYVGGGALFGTVLGAIAGGGKGAAIGALAGGAAGAGAQTLTRGKSINIPAETVLSFRLDRDMSVYADSGYDRDGHHYHRYQNQ